MTLDAIEKRAIDARMYPGRSSSEQTAALAATMIVLVKEIRLARAWLAERDRFWKADAAGARASEIVTGQKKLDEAREAYRAFLAKQEAP